MLYLSQNGLIATKRKANISIEFWRSNVTLTFDGLRMRRKCWERFPRLRFRRKPLVSVPYMHHGTCVITRRDACRDRWPAVVGKTFQAFPAHAQPVTSRICQEAHGSLRHQVICSHNTGYDKWGRPRLPSELISIICGISILCEYVTIIPKASQHAKC